MSDRVRLPEARLYVANLSYKMTAEDVAAMFSEVGEVLDVYLPTLRDTQHHKGYGFVEMSTAQEAQDAIDEFHGEEDLYGRELTVRIADRDRNV